MLLALASASPADAGGQIAAVDERVIASCIHRKSGGHVWLERTLWGLRDREGGWVGAVIANTNGTYDLGPLQVNSSWVREVADLTRRSATNVRWWLIHDACFNVDVARWIFLSDLARTHVYWDAVGAYHSPTNWRRREYAAGVASLLERRFGQDAFRQSVRSQVKPRAKRAE
jgi:hypothetical protein